MEYTDCITCENIDIENLISIKVNNEIYHFDALTLHKYKNESSEYLNPFTKTKLDDETIKKVEYCIKNNYNYIIIVFFNDICNGKYEMYVNKKNNDNIMVFLKNFTKHYDMFSHFLSSETYVVKENETVKLETLCDKSLNELGNITIFVKINLNIENVKQNMLMYEKYFSQDHEYIELNQYLNDFDVYVKNFVEASETDDIESIIWIYSLPANGIHVISNDNFKILYTLVDKGKRNIITEIVNEFLFINLIYKFVDDIIVYSLISKKIFVLPTLMSFLIESHYEMNYNLIIKNIEKIDINLLNYFISMLTNLQICEFFNYNESYMVKYYISNGYIELLNMYKQYFTLESLKVLKEQTV